MKQRLVTILVVVAAAAPGSLLAQGPRKVKQNDVPLIISVAGSYVLTENLHVSDPEVTAIRIVTDDVLIDLGGFSIQGPELGPVGAGSAIDAVVRSNITVRNGTVRGFYDPASACIHLPGRNNKVENMDVQHCPQEAVFVGSSGAVVDNHISDSASGINTDDGTLVARNTVHSASNHCIMTSGGAPSGPGGVTVVGNNCRNSGTGIRVIGSGNRVQDNVITGTGTGLDLSGSVNSYFASNLLQGNATPVVGGGDDLDGATVDAALSNLVLP